MAECQVCLKPVHFKREQAKLPPELAGHGKPAKPNTAGIAGTLVHSDGSTDHPVKVAAGEGHLMNFGPTPELTPPPLTASHEERRAWQQRRAEHLASQAQLDPEAVSPETTHQPGPVVRP